MVCTLASGSGKVEVQTIRQVAIDFQPVESEIFLILQVENQLQPV